MQANATRQPSRTAAAPSRRGVIAQESSQSVPRAQVGARALEQRDGARVDVEHHRAEPGHGEAHRGAVVGAGAPVARPVARPGLSETKYPPRQQAIEAAAKQRAEERRRQAEEDAARPASGNASALDPHNKIKAELRVESGERCRAVWKIPERCLRPRPACLSPEARPA